MTNYYEVIANGEKAFRSGLAVEENPHDKGTEKYDAWRTGWYGAQDFEEYENGLRG